MTENLATYIALPGTTKEAFTHWQEVLGGDLTLVTYGDMPGMDVGFTPDPEAVAHATLDFPFGSLAGSDAIMPGEHYNVEGSAYSLLLTLDSAERAHEVADAFVGAGGRVGMPVETAPWGDLYGQVFDRFGVMWALSVPGSE